MAKRDKKKLVSFTHKALFNASKTLLANIRFSSIDDRMKTIVVTSASSSEGKTIVSTNLANAVATSGKSVLIVDCDMRNRCLHKLLDIRPQYGIYSVLSEQATVDQAISATNIDNLFFLDSEPGIPSPPDILSTPQFEQLVEELRCRFDYVIFDTPPLSLFVDAAIISSVVDGTLLVMRQRKTKREMAIEALQQLRTANAHLLGSVMTFCPADTSDYYYAYYTQDGKRVNPEEQGANSPTNFEPLKSSKPNARKTQKQPGGRHGIVPSYKPAKDPEPTFCSKASLAKTEQFKPIDPATKPQPRPNRASNPYTPNAFRNAAETLNSDKKRKRR